MKVNTPHGTWDETCTRCALHACRAGHAPIYGSGNGDADYLIVTEAPTINDVADQELYTGATGEMLLSLLEATNIDPANTFRTTVVSCPHYVIIPPTDDDESERISYQKPSAEMVKACSPRLHEVIYRVDPRLIITFGELAWKALVPTKSRDNKTKLPTNGELFDCYTQGRGYKIRYPLAAFVSLETLAGNPSQADHAPIQTTVRALRRMVEITLDLKQQELK